MLPPHGVLWCDSYPVTVSPDVDSVWPIRAAQVLTEPSGEAREPSPALSVSFATKSSIEVTLGDRVNMNSKSLKCRPAGARIPPEDVPSGPPLILFKGFTFLLRVSRFGNFLARSRRFFV